MTLRDNGFRDTLVSNELRCLRKDFYFANIFVKVLL